MKINESLVDCTHYELPFILFFFLELKRNGIDLASTERKRELCVRSLASVYKPKCGFFFQAQPWAITKAFHGESCCLHTRFGAQPLHCSFWGELKSRVQGPTGWSCSSHICLPNYRTFFPYVYILRSWAEVFQCLC